MKRNTPTGPSIERLGRALSPRIQAANTLHSQSPSHIPRREPPGDMSRDQSLLHSGQASPAHVIAVESGVSSMRSSPALHSERKALTPLRSRSRSPTRPPLSFRPSGQPVRSPHGNQNPDIETAAGAGKEQEVLGRSAERESLEQPQMGGVRIGGSIPTQPRSLGISNSPPFGPYQGPKVASSQHRGSHNMSLLSAPTRPRRGHGARDAPWTGVPIGRGRGPPPPALHSTPSGPRASFNPPVPTGSYRHSGSRQNSSTSAASSPAPRGPNHLAGLGSVIPGGRSLPSPLDAATEKRLAQLELDKERLLEQMAETQRSKRAGLRDWDRLDRESSICALKSELAEGHLQRMADESHGGGILF